ncbi:hypothetical protein CS053_16025 [Rhodanobacter glycinis]|uniref:Uncharacterized protein n=1 Tax=Rhodanobacter glycinis TaxID=582702 RepID=A0A5B9E2R4_9GAMM|nr:hypothetical protein [Rhodanobacter glycinis]QEE25844.1 hypothetical protein CS053_16025 [Rhodanobacter glycinis]
MIRMIHFHAARHQTDAALTRKCLNSTREWHIAAHDYQAATRSPVINPTRFKRRRASTDTRQGRQIIRFSHTYSLIAYVCGSCLCSQRLPSIPVGETSTSRVSISMHGRAPFQK